MSGRLQEHRILRGAIVHYTHFVSDSVRREVAKLVSDVGEELDVWVTGCCRRSDSLDGLNGLGVRRKCFTREDLKTLPYEIKLSKVNWDTLRGDNDLALLKFFQECPGYAYYWFVEYDVRFSGSWGELVSELSNSDADLLCTHLASHRQAKGWMLWEEFDSGAEVVNIEDRVKGFLPFFRVSNRLMAAVDEVYKKGWRGHYEVVWPTLAKLRQYTLEDIGGQSEFTPKERRGKYYCSAVAGPGIYLSTFSAWPFYSEKSSFAGRLRPKNTLWHPVKD